MPWLGKELSELLQAQKVDLFLFCKNQVAVLWKLCAPAPTGGHYVHCPWKDKKVRLAWSVWFTDFRGEQFPMVTVQEMTLVGTASLGGRERRLPYWLWGSQVLVRPGCWVGVPLDCWSLRMMRVAGEELKTWLKCKSFIHDKEHLKVRRWRQLRAGEERVEHDMNLTEQGLYKNEEWWGKQRYKNKNCSPVDFLYYLFSAAFQKRTWGRDY